MNSLLLKIEIILCCLKRKFRIGVYLEHVVLLNYFLTAEYTIIWSWYIFIFVCYIFAGEVWRGHCCTCGNGEESCYGRINVGGYFTVPNWSTENTTFSTVTLPAFLFIHCWKLMCLLLSLLVFFHVYLNLVVALVVGVVIWASSFSSIFINNKSLYLHF